MTAVVEKFMRYVQLDTQSDETTLTSPSTEKQKILARMLEDELKALGLNEVYMDEQHCYVYAKLPASKGCEQCQTLGFIAHMDTSPDAKGANVRPRIIKDYDGGEVLLNDEPQTILSPKQFPELLDYVGKSLIVTDGTTLLGADDKAGIAEIMATVEWLSMHEEIKHGPIAVAFTPDEEIGNGVDYFDLKQFGADVAYTVDGGGIGELEYENFNAASAIVTINGINVHPGEAKHKMKHASRIAMEFEQMLPVNEKPEFTEGYEGFYHLTDMKGDVERAELKYIIRDHNRERFEEKKNSMYALAEKLNTKYGADTVCLTIEDSYYNMREKIEPDYMFLIELAKCAMEANGVTPKIQPIRGGTDGARLSFMGLPCPNICTGGHNYHGRYEYVCVESMNVIVDILVKLVSDFLGNYNGEA